MSSPAPVSVTDASTNWSERARYFNSGNAFALKLPPVPSVQFNAERDEAFASSTPTKLIDMDLSASLETSYPATTPLVLSRYMRIRAGESMALELRASAQLMVVLTGSGSTSVLGETASWGRGDVLALPGAAVIEHTAHEDVVAWLVTDEPALNFQELYPSDPRDASIAPVIYTAKALEDELDALYKHPDVKTFPGYAVVLSHQALESTRNIHPTLTLALNSLPPGEFQRPHVHNSMALTLCLEGEDCFSMIDGERKDWQPHAVMLTPPCASHSHHNDGDKNMRCMIVQDGGLYYHTRAIGFAFSE